MTKKNKAENSEIVEEQNINTNEAVEHQAEETTEQAEETTDDLATLQEKCDELSDKNLRLMAEFDNYRKRTIKEKGELIKTANEKVLIDLLSVVDDFERAKMAIDSSEDITALREGVELIYDKFIVFLAQKGVKAIATENADFDVEFHEAITTFPAPSEEQKGKIIDCVSKGYTLNEKVIRFSKVVVGE